MPLWLNEADVRAVLPLADLIETMAATLGAFSGGRAVQPVRAVVDMGTAFFAAMPAFVNNALGAKLVSIFPSNSQRALPTHQASIVLCDAETGALLAIMDGRYVTEARTAAVSALAVRLLADPNAATLALIGTGVQAASHLEALSIVHRFRSVRCWSPTAEHRERFAREHGVEAAPSAQHAVTDAGVIVLATASVTPVIESGWVKDGSLVISVGACRPTHREMDPALVARARLIVDSRASALHESGDVVMGIAEKRFTPDHISAELGELSGPAHTGEVTVFKPLGLGVEDAAAAQLAYRRALATGRGVALA